MATGSAKWITWRSVLIGSAGAAGLCALVPYNDYVVANTYMVGSYMPPVLVLLMLVLVMVVNGPFYRFKPHLALSRGELGTIMAMLLAACSIPSQGFMRSFLPNMVWPFHFGQTNPTWWGEFSGLHLPGWLFPTHRSGGDPVDLISEYFYSGIPHDVRMSIPYGAWITPIVAWGVFTLAMMATLIALAVLVLPQWATNERLPFPLSQVQIALIEPPRPGKAFNAIIGDRLFWLAVLGVCFIQGTNGLHVYFPKMPFIPTGYDLNSVFTEPWSAASGLVKKNGIFFTFVGVTYFIQGRMSFSLWAIYIAQQLLNVWLHDFNINVMSRGADDQQLGACVAYVAGALWIGRHHWALVISSSLGRRRMSPDLQRFASARLALLVAIAGIITMAAWMTFLGISPQTTALVISMILIVHGATARIVCETGLPFFRAQITAVQVCRALPVNAFSLRDIYFAGVMDATALFTSRESSMTFSLLAMRDNDTPQLKPRQGRGVLALMIWAMLLGTFTSAWSSLHCYYTHGRPLSSTISSPTINPYVLNDQPPAYVMHPVEQRATGHWPLPDHNPWVYMGTSAAITAFLQFASARWSAWPLMPVGYVASKSWYVETAWFSVFLGWLAKVLIIRFGGTKLYTKLRPLFIGMICGECLSTGIWLVINLLLASAGYEYRYVNFLPT